MISSPYDDGTMGLPLVVIHVFSMDDFPWNKPSMCWKFPMTMDTPISFFTTMVTDGALE